METHEILIAARKLIETPEKWGKGGNGPTPVGSRCLYLALDGNADEEDAAMRALGFGSIREVYDWNDAKERTHAEVLARLDAAIEKLRAVQP
jgi:hypothetical protein